MDDFRSERAWVYDFRSPPKELTRDELVKLIRKWESTVHWNAGVSFVAKHNEFAKRLGALDRVEDNSPEAEIAKQEAYAMAKSWGLRAANLTAEIVWITNAIRRLAPGLLLHVPVVDFFIDPPDDPKRLAQSMRALEGAFLQYEKDERQNKSPVKTNPEDPEKTNIPPLPSSEVFNWLEWEKVNGGGYRKKTPARRAYIKSIHPGWTKDQIEADAENLRKKIEAYEKKLMEWNELNGK